MIPSPKRRRRKYRSVSSLTGAALATAHDVNRYLRATTFQRLGALLVDVLIFIVSVMVPATLISWWFGPAELTVCEFSGPSESCSVAPEALRFTRTVAYALAGVWLFAYAATISTGSSIGKRATEILVVDVSSGETIGYWRALLRTVLSVVGVVFCGVGLLYSVVHTQRRALHDLAVRTRVISP